MSIIICQECGESMSDISEWFCADCVVEMAAKMVKLDGYSKICGWCTNGLPSGTLGFRLGYCSPKCRDKAGVSA